MSEIDQLIKFIQNKGWLGVDEVADAMRIERVRLERMVRFLAEFKLIEVRGRKIRICADTNDFLKSVSRKRKI